MFLAGNKKTFILKVIIDSFSEVGAVMKLAINENLLAQIKNLPHKPGVYLFKDAQQYIIYIGKAKDLKNRVSQYVQRLGSELKADLILTDSVALDYTVTHNELEALLLEAQLIQSNQPQYNVLLKAGQPFLYIMISSGSLPILSLTRHKKKKGTYFGPFIEKKSARKVFQFLERTFRLKICGKKIPGGCLAYHIGLCAGTCKSNFNQEAYKERIGLARDALQKGHKKFLQYLLDQIQLSNKQLNFEKSKELYGYYEAFSRVFESLITPHSSDFLLKKDIWILSSTRDYLAVLEERNSVIKQKEVFYFHFDYEDSQEMVKEYFTSFYRNHMPALVILMNVELGDDRILYESFLQQWHKTENICSILTPTDGHYARLVKMAEVQMQEFMAKRASLASMLKKLLLLPKEPQTIDCFDISHQQGKFMVGSCVRFLNGQPDKHNFRHFIINSLDQQNDYAALREIVSRRYRNQNDIPDLILIDGGKGQLNAVKDLFPEASFASLAKREETIFSDQLPEGKVLDKKSVAGQVLIALRDYTHHFAISFHRKRSRLIA